MNQYLRNFQLPSYQSDELKIIVDCRASGSYVEIDAVEVMGLRKKQGNFTITDLKVYIINSRITKYISVIFPLFICEKGANGQQMA